MTARTPVLSDEAAVYGQRWAEIYDSYPAHPPADDAESAADLLYGLVGHGTAVEFGIGTGRVALPLAARGVRVRGIDASPAMLEQLLVKPGADTIETTTGDITDTRIWRDVSLVYAAFNTVLMVLTQAGQVACFRNAAAHLSARGYFVVEAFIPDFAKLTGTDAVLVRHIDDDGAWLLSTHHEPLRQIIRSDTIRVGVDGTRRYPTALRYAWPQEMDLMAQLAGFRLIDRFADWRRAPLTAASRNHVSIYQLTD